MNLAKEKLRPCTNPMCKNGRVFVGAERFSGYGNYRDCEFCEGTGVMEPYEPPCVCNTFDNDGNERRCNEVAP
jgi:hypothetical protein